MPKDHYVPQFYLRNFEITPIPNRIQPNHVYSYKRNFSPIPLPIQSVANEIDFDRISEGEKARYSKIYNEILRNTENSSPPIISKIIQDSTFSISDNDKTVLAWFIALLATRTPTAHQYFVKDIMSFQEKINERVKKDCISNEQEIHKILKRNNPKVTEEEINEFKKFILETNFNSFWKFSENDNNKSYIRSLGAVQAESLVNDLLVKNWHLLIITSEEVFITSDNPVSFLFPRLVGVKNQIHTESPVFLPLSPKKALYIHPYNFSDKTIFLNNNQVDYFVKETVKHAKECVYSNIKSNKPQEILNATPFNLSNLNYEFNFPPYFQIKAFWKSAFKHFAEIRND